MSSPIRTAVAAALLCVAAAAAADQAAPPAAQPPSFGGRYPHLAVSNAQGECGIGAVVPWAGRLWFITYGPHLPLGSDDGLYEVDDSLALTRRPESVGGTPAARLVHRETETLALGPYLIDKTGAVHAVPPAEMEGRLTAHARSLSEPDRKLLVYDMEGLHYELDLESRKAKRLFARAVPGWHGKGGYSGQGVLVVANNGEHASGTVDKFKPFDYAVPDTRANQTEAGALAEWDGTTWKLVRRRQFTDVTGPGGILGPPSPDAPLWALGWDEKSVLLLVRSAADAAPCVRTVSTEPARIRIGRSSSAPRVSAVRCFGASPVCAGGVTQASTVGGTCPCATPGDSAVCSREGTSSQFATPSTAIAMPSSTRIACGSREVSESDGQPTFSRLRCATTQRWCARHSWRVSLSAMRAGLSSSALSGRCTRPLVSSRCLIACACVGMLDCRSDHATAQPVAQNSPASTRRCSQAGR